MCGVANQAEYKSTGCRCLYKSATHNILRLPLLRMLEAVNIAHAAGVLPIWVHYGIWMVCNTHFPEHRTPGGCSGSTYLLQLDGVSSSWRTHASSAKEHAAGYIRWRHCRVFCAPEDNVSSESMLVYGSCCQGTAIRRETGQ